MWKALAYKELRESLRIVSVALLCFVLVLGAVMGLPTLPFGSSGGGGAIPFVGGSFLSWYVMIAGGLALGLGLGQSLGESPRGTWLYLLHRPVQRWKLIAWKLAVGGGLFLLVTLWPMLVYAWWAATPGRHASPFEWSMTLPCWQGWVSITPLYLGAFLTGLRPARWFGSRLLPLAGAGTLIFVIQALPWWWLLGVAAVLVLDVWLIAAVFYVAQVRDY